MNFKKSFLALALAGILFASCKQTATEPTKDETATTETSTTATPGKIETASFSIEGMSCEVMCASKIQKELTKTEGVQNATIDFEKKTATVEYDSGKTTPEKLVETVEAVNGGDSYKVSNVKSSADQAMFFKEKEKKKSRKQRKAEEKAAAEKSCSTEEAKSDKPGCCKSKKSCSSSETKKENTL
ncbi:copper chaperone CopZ [Flavobacterium arsenatis]|uniref:Copper chaperone CopZ n=1 Tax=Flavobacterium arsenatis TaxID=1484332 RepID=A0ABU1TSY6_9FLAO|nr:heavy-metal-associated domain-containing protein [Flavobacterium arsenatis]MDR6968931.1 copper chaperone CopZ [Flavobacterium arsenatis]